MLLLDLLIRLDPNLNINGTKLYLEDIYGVPVGNFQYELINGEWVQDNTVNGKISNDFSTIVNSSGAIYEFSTINNQWEVTGTIPGASGNDPKWDINSDGTVVMTQDYQVGVNVYQKTNNSWSQMGNTITYNGIIVNQPRGPKLSSDGQTIAFYEPTSSTSTWTSDIKNLYF